MKKIKFLFILLLLIPTFVLADTGPKPSITVKLKNIEGTDYLIDLMSNFSNQESLIDGIVDRYTDYKEREIYKYHEDNWYATSLRNSILWGNIEGNDNHVHEFRYFGVPNEFKIIIELSDGTIKVSKKVKKTAYNFDITIDVNDMRVVGESSNNEYTEDEEYLNHVDIYVGVLTLTILVEVGIALIFKTKKYHIIALVNLLTNVCLQLLMINISAFSSSILYFVLIEIPIIVIEGILYLEILKIDKKKIILYTVIANLVTALLTFVL